MKQTIFIFLISLLIVSCQKETGNNTPGNLQEQYLTDVTYGADAKQKLDVYLPSGRNTTATKSIIMIHGGAWSSGDKSEMTPFIDTLKNRLPGYAVFNLNYRLVTGTLNTFPTQENDIKMAMEYIWSKKSEYNISDKFVLLGVSAGGHLALLQGYKYDSPIKVKAIVDFFGPTDMTDLYNNPASIFIPSATIESVVGATPSSNPVLYQQSSPVTFVNSQCPPTIMLHGGLDPLVSPNQSIALRDLLINTGVVNQYVFYPTELHGWTGANLKDSFDKIAAFLMTNVN